MKLIEVRPRPRLRSFHRRLLRYRNRSGELCRSAFSAGPDIPRSAHAVPHRATVMIAQAIEDHSCLAMRSSGNISSTINSESWCTVQGNRFRSSASPSISCSSIPRTRNGWLPSAMVPIRYSMKASADRDHRCSVRVIGGWVRIGGDLP